MRVFFAREWLADGPSGGPPKITRVRARWRRKRQERMRALLWRELWRARSVASAKKTSKKVAPARAGWS